MITFDVAVAAATPYDALVECARAGIPGPVITSDEGCMDHMHAYVTTDDYDGQIQDQLMQLVCEDTNHSFLALMIYENLG